MNPVLHGFIYLAALVGVMSVGGMEAAFTMTLGTTIILFMQLDSEQKKINEILTNLAIPFFYSLVYDKYIYMKITRSNNELFNLLLTRLDSEFLFPWYNILCTSII